MYLSHYQTMKLSFEQICGGKRPWTALGNFMNDWYAYHSDERERLIIDPLPQVYPAAFQQWAAFCSASARRFCSTYEVCCPTWVDDPQYVLSEPWYMDHRPSLWQRLRETTAEEFSRHNIYCGNWLYTNKYERDEQGLPLKAHPIDLQERHALVRIAAERLAREDAEWERCKQKYLPLRHSRLSSADNQQPVV